MHDTCDYPNYIGDGRPPPPPPPPTHTQRKCLNVHYNSFTTPCNICGKSVTEPLIYCTCTGTTNTLYSSDTLYIFHFLLLQGVLSISVPFEHYRTAEFVQGHLI